MTNGLHCVVRWSETEDGTWDGASELIEKLQRKLDAGFHIVGEKSAREEFGGGLRLRDGNDPMRWSLLQEENGGERSTGRRRNAGVAVPGRAVHAIACRLMTKNDAVGAEKACGRLADPEARGGAFAGAGMAEEEITAGILIDEAEGVEFDAFAESEAMHEDEFVDGILEWKERIVGLEAFAVQDDMATRKGRIEPGSFIRTAAEGGTGEIKSSATVIAMGGPEASGAKSGADSGARSSEAQETSNSRSQGESAPDGARNGMCSGSRATGIPCSHQRPREKPPIRKAKRVGSEAACVANFVRRWGMVIFRVEPLQEPNVLQKKVRQLAAAGPVELKVLQWPRTASSGRRLTRTTSGG